MMFGGRRALDRVGILCNGSDQTQRKSHSGHIHLRSISGAGFCRRALTRDVCIGLSVFLRIFITTIVKDKYKKQREGNY